MAPFTDQVSTSKTGTHIVAVAYYPVVNLFRTCVAFPRTVGGHCRLSEYIRDVSLYEDVREAHPQYKQGYIVCTTLKYRLRGTFYCPKNGKKVPIKGTRLFTGVRLFIFK